MTKSLTILLAVVLITITSVGVTSFAFAQQPQTSGFKAGTISSIQYGKNGKPEWILSGGWDLRNINSSSPGFNAGFNMVMLNGSAPHMHVITDFKMTGTPITKGTATTYNGTATILLKKGPVKGVPISIKLIGTSVVNLWIDPAKTEGHFGNTPIYGVQSGIR
jgi:hypothetical protein